MEAPRTILFLCPHGAAKSVIAAAYCRRLAARRGLAVRAVAAGTEPDAEVAPVVVAALRGEGIDVSGHRPRLVTRRELAAAWRVVSLGCDLGALALPSVVPDRWDDLPPAGRDVAAACAAIGARVEELLDRIPVRDEGRDRP